MGLWRMLCSILCWGIHKWKLKKSKNSSNKQFCNKRINSIARWNLRQYDEWGWIFKVVVKCWRWRYLFKVNSTTDEQNCSWNTRISKIKHYKSKKHSRSIWIWFHDWRKLQGMVDRSEQLTKYGLFNQNNRKASEKWFVWSWWSCSELHVWREILQP